MRRRRDSSGTPTGGLPTRLRGEATIAVGIATMNVATYAYTMVAARVLGPGAYGAFAGLMATLLVLGVLQLGLQATAARRISADPDHTGQIQRVILKVSLRAGLLLGLVTVLLAPVLAWVLRIDHLLTPALVGIAVVPLTLMGGQAGILQGERRWGALAAVYVSAGVPRLLIGTALVLWRPTETAAMVGVVIAAFVPVVVGHLCLRGSPEARQDSADHVLRPVTWEAVRNSQALLAFFALSNVDIVVARNVLSEHQAGLYAGGLILTKAVLFLPQFVVIVAFPAMSTAAERSSALFRSLVLVTFIGAACTVGALVLPGLALIFVGGSQYAEIEGDLWYFAVLGTLLALLQLLVYSVVARQGRRSVYLVWGALGGIVALGSFASSVPALVATVIAVDAVLLGALIAVDRMRASLDAAADGRGRVATQAD